jgi:hypothetical protein
MGEAGNDPICVNIALNLGRDIDLPSICPMARRGLQVGHKRHR